MTRQIRNLYIAFTLFGVFVMVTLLNQNFIADKFTYGLLGILFLFASIAGLLTRSFFLGSAFIVPYSSDSILVKLTNIFIGFIGVVLLLYNIFF